MANFSNSVKYSGLDSLNLLEKAKLRNIIESRYTKISRILKEPSDLSINLKLHEKEKKKKYSIHGRLECASKVFSAKAFDWDIKKVSHEITNKIESEVRKKFKVEQKGWRSGLREFIKYKLSK